MILRLLHTPWWLVRSELLTGHLHLQLVACFQPTVVLIGDHRGVVRIAYHYVTWGGGLSLILAARWSRAPLGVIIIMGSRFLPWGVRPRKIHSLPTTRSHWWQGSSFKGVSWVCSIATAFTRHLQAKNNMCQCVPPSIKESWRLKRKQKLQGSLHRSTWLR